MRVFNGGWLLVGYILIICGVCRFPELWKR